MTLRPFDLWAVGPARQLCQRKEFRIYAGPNATSDATIALSAALIAAPRALGTGGEVRNGPRNEPRGEQHVLVMK